MSTNDHVSVYSLLLAPSGAATPADSESTIQESAISDLLVAYSLTSSIVWARQHASESVESGDIDFEAFLARLETGLKARNIYPERVLTAETLRSWCDGLVRQELLTPAFTTDDALRLRTLIPSMVPHLPNNEEGEGLRLLFLQMIDSLDAFLIER